MELKERVIVVTGAGQGLGKQFALDCASEGARLALADLNLETVEKVASECRDAGGEARPYQMDVCSEGQVVAFYEQVVKDFGSLDATINNAGVVDSGIQASKIFDHLLVKGDHLSFRTNIHLVGTGFSPSIPAF